MELPTAGQFIHLFIGSKQNFDNIQHQDDSIYLLTDTNQVYVGDTEFLNKWDELYPVGSVIVFADSDDHSNHLGLHWKKFSAGRVLVGDDPSDPDFSKIGAIGGEKSHTLTIEEMPAHTHRYSLGGTIAGTKPAMWHALEIDNVQAEGAINNSGGDTPHNNLPPYQVVQYYVRIS